MFLFISCTENINKIGCGEITNVEFDRQDSVWVLEAKDSLYYQSNRGGNIVLSLFENKVHKLSIENCNRPIGLILSYSCSKKIDLINVAITRYEQKKGINTTILYSFSQMTENLIPISSQPMGLIDVRINQPINTEEIDFVQTTKLGTHQLNGKTYNDVFVIEDLDKNEVPEIDIFRFYVNPSGILRIEFYDGEIWDRVD
ncbi:hypothetical protein Fleli_3164 [Bernardetia litoralis DSM 6794]|uniref:Uncharacterized protein n=2 Tax=Bernardetia litoralis TaxID=999 RepID=I4ANG5_BERLS|nr:hypothetical protein Fleli_3164 [Bernardetia litoralis DSM 6794]